mmetsp:Transcript_22059/g.33018  ORF Transcript_22059/g.33018 Transcript_22059/m.33018 type:complete len:111 (+) Transcript_22059:1205-1537(+)
MVGETIEGTEVVATVGEGVAVVGEVVAVVGGLGKGITGGKRGTDIINRRVDEVETGEHMEMEGFLQTIPGVAGSKYLRKGSIHLIFSTFLLYEVGYTLVKSSSRCLRVKC